jgi:hypothetical protein
VNTSSAGAGSETKTDASSAGAAAVVSVEPTVSEVGHGVPIMEPEELGGEPAIDLDRDIAVEREDLNDVTTCDSPGNMVVFNKLEIDKFKADKKHKKAPSVRLLVHSCTSPVACLRVSRCDGGCTPLWPGVA